MSDTHTPAPAPLPAGAVTQQPLAETSGVPLVAVPLNILGNLVQAVDSARRHGAFDQLHPQRSYLVHHALVHGLELLAPYEVQPPPSA